MSCYKCIPSWIIQSKRLKLQIIANCKKKKRQSTRLTQWKLSTRTRWNTVPNIFLKKTKMAIAKPMIMFSQSLNENSRAAHKTASVSLKYKWRSMSLLKQYKVFERIIQKHTLKHPSTTNNHISEGQHRCVLGKSIPTWLLAH